MKRAVAALALCCCACGYNGLDFVRDERIEIVAPKDRAVVSLPLDVAWTVRDFDGSFAVFVDRNPQPAGETLEWFTRDDEQCRALPGCPDETYFTAKDIYTTSVPQLRIDRLSTLTSDEEYLREFHEVIVVLLDAQGRRIGESAFSTEFELEGVD